MVPSQMVAREFLQPSGVQRCDDGNRSLASWQDIMSSHVPPASGLSYTSFDSFPSANFSLRPRQYKAQIQAQTLAKLWLLNLFFPQLPPRPTALPQASVSLPASKSNRKTGDLRIGLYPMSCSQHHLWVYCRTSPARSLGPV